MNYHLIGIQGSSMSGLARILQQLGHQVGGCDLKKLKIYHGHDPKHITKDLDAVIISAAITPNSKAWPEVEKAKKLGISVISRSKMIGRLMSTECEGIAIAGTHGKTTTAAMIFWILEKAGKNPSFLIGGDFGKLGSGKWQKGKYFVVEACEYARQFLDFRPKIAVITNIEEEHLDTYPGGFNEIKKAFKKFVRHLPQNGLLVLNQEDKTTSWLKKIAKCKVKTFSFKKPWPGLKLKILGEHNALNATAAARVCHEITVPHQIIKEALNSYEGVKRRLEYKGEKNRVLVLDDYAHHPTEIQTTLKAVKEFYPGKRIICVFQAHQYARTKFFLKEFGTSFADCDKVILASIFAVAGRDPTSPRLRGASLEEALLTEIKKHHKDVIYLKNYDDIVKYLKKERTLSVQTKNGDVIITMGATDIYKVGEKFLREL